MGGVLTARIAKVASKPVCMYSQAGAMFQEWAIARLDYKGSPAHKAIGSLVTAINNNQITIESAELQFNRLLSN